MTIHDDLFRPTIRPEAGPLPWFTAHLFLAAILGGPATSAVLGALNARRLWAGKEVPWIAAAGVLGLAAFATVATIEGAPLSFVCTTNAAAGAAVHLVVSVRLRVAERVFALSGERRAALGKPATIAIGGGVCLSALIVAVARMLA